MRFLLILAFAIMLISPRQGEAEPGAAAAIRDVIENQLEAFKAGDAEAAFAYATPAVRQRFGTAEHFIAMVREGYSPIYRNRSFVFGPLGDHHGATIQIVNVVGEDGEAAHAYYIMERQGDGDWRIAGCMLAEPPGFNT